MKTLKLHLHFPKFILSYRLTVLLSYHFIVLSSLLFISPSLFAQNEANIWYFQDTTGLDFNTGMPDKLDDGQLRTGRANATISDSLGNFLFCTDWQGIYHDHGIMQNSEDMPCPGISGRVIVKWPGKESFYYVFTAVVPYHPDPGLKYAVVDLSIGFWGAVTEKNIPVDIAWDVGDRITIVQQENSENVWVLVRKYVEDAYAAFLVDENGFQADPVLSPMPDQFHNNWESSNGHIKISYDKKYLVTDDLDRIEICSFNAANGTLEHLYNLGPVNFACPYVAGMEFSPDSKYLYVSFSEPSNQDDSCHIYQYDMELIEDSILFYNSAILIGGGNSGELQLARDGKIYGYTRYWGIESFYCIGIIHKPWIRGDGCEYEDRAIITFPSPLTGAFPNILKDYLLRFEWTGETCQGYPIHFKPNFIPTPQTIQWDFDDGPGSNSWQLSPTYTFKNPGIHEVKVDVWYPSGRHEHTSREIEISPSPLPLLGLDTLICEGASITLNANCNADFFAWSTGQFGISSITVSDSGTYWVRGRFNDSGCMGYDTIHIGYHPPTLIDETNLEITPTTCNGTSGSITGLTALGPTPYAFQWLDLSGNPYGTNIDATNLPAGQYQLSITDGNGCQTVSEIYTIEDAGNLQVLEVEITRPHCERPDGEIVIHAYSPSGSGLEYSINDGADYSLDSIFTGLLAGTYVVRIKDINNCEGFYIDNPISIADIPGPQVIEVIITYETDFLGNGAIEIVAGGFTPVIYYSIDGGATWQENDGNFYNLQSRVYNLQIRDENGCDTSFTVEIQNIILTYLHAVTGEEGICEDSTALIPVNVDNFNNVADFHLKLGFNADNLQCEGFTNVHLELLDSLTGWVDHAAGDIHLAWNAPNTVTFTGTEKVADLVFTTKNPGQGELAWYTGETESYFTNSSGNPIPAEFSTGQVTVYEPPRIILDQSKTVCTGQFVSLMSIAIGNQPPIDYQWIYPDGDTTNNDPFFFSVSQADAGLYTLLATDRVGCTDQKSIELIVSENPVAAFHGTDTLEMQAGDILDAGAGLASFLWNTGDSTESIVIQAEGLYWVGMESLIGCNGSDSVYVKLTEKEIPPEPNNSIFIPNAFSPDGDGVNDSFNISYSNNSFPISHFVLHIFNRWGEEIFESTDITQGWDGKKNGNPCSNGVYVYKIVFSLDGVPGSQERVGTVMLVR